MKITLGVDAINLRGGGIIHLKKIFNNLDYDNRFEKIVIWGNKELLSSIKKSNKILKIHNNLYERSLIMRLIWTIFNFRKEIIKHKIDCMYYPNGIALFNDVPSVLFIQNILPFDKKIIKNYNLKKKIKFFIQKFLISKSAHKSSKIIFPSNYSRDIFLKHNAILNFKSFVIYHGADKKFLIKKNNKSKILGVYPATLEKYKNHDILLDVFEILEKNIFIDFYVSGSKKEIKNFQKKIINFKNLKIIKFKNYELKYKKYDFLIFPSLCESFGLPLAEAAVSGMKVLCSNIKIFREILGKYPIFFDPHSKKSIISALNNINKKKNNIKNISKIKKKFDWNKCSKKTLSLIYSTFIYEKKRKRNFIDKP